MTASLGSVQIGPVRLLHVGPGLALAEIDHVCVAIWRSAVTKHLFNWQHFCLTEVVQRHPKGTAFVCIVEPGCAPPDEELRRASVDMIAEHESRLRCVAVAIEGEGFRAAITRTVLSGMMLLLPNRRVPVSYVSSVGTAAEWVSRHLPLRSTDMFVSAVEEVRARIGEHED